ncbi:MAG: hypothetical protein A4E31_00554 [Methanomassiliicoccales archaeon PtaU1.Bin030]|nr:MAG: hypothetical protein A4E31_00554 [Methanomassiliicoccales archaeon PtaU1.Bin030]
MMSLRAAALAPLSDSALLMLSVKPVFSRSLMMSRETASLSFSDIRNEAAYS